MKQRLKFSTFDLLIAIAIIAAFLATNLIQRDVGSGVRIILIGWPFPAATTHSLNGLTIFWIGTTANVVIGVCLAAFAAIIACKLRRLLLQKYCNPDRLTNA